MLGSKSIISFEDARAKAKRKLPRMIFDFIEGSAGREIASDRNSEIFNDIFLKSKVLAEIKDPKLNSKFLNYSFDFPFEFANFWSSFLLKRNFNSFLNKKKPFSILFVPKIESKITKIMNISGEFKPNSFIKFHILFIF